MKRILVVGSSGSGKSTLAKQLSEYLQLPFFPSDGFYWEPKWKIVPTDKVRQQINSVISQNAWILDGNFDDEHEVVWQQADCIIWLDYSLLTVLKQIMSRNLHWTLTRQRTWSGNTMTMQRAISGIWHAVKSYPLKRKKYPLWLSELSDVTVFRFCSKQETEIWLRDLNE